MTRHLFWALLCVGCASASPPEPKVVERVVYVEAPCCAPVIAPHHGHRAKSKHGYGRHPYGKHRVEHHGKHRVEHHGKHRPEYAKKRLDRCDRKPNPEARERCRRMISRNKDRHR
jgi:hypothetical protein